MNFFLATSVVWLVEHPLELSFVVAYLNIQSPLHPHNYHVSRPKESLDTAVPCYHQCKNGGLNDRFIPAESAKRSDNEKPHSVWHFFMQHMAHASKDANWLHQCIYVFKPYVIKLLLHFKSGYNKVDINWLIDACPLEVIACIMDKAYKSRAFGKLNPYCSEI